MHIVSHLSVLLSSRYINVHTYIYKLTDIIVISPTSRSGCSSIFSRTMNFSRMNHSYESIFSIDTRTMYSSNADNNIWYSISRIFSFLKKCIQYLFLIDDIYTHDSIQEKKYCFHNCTHFVNIQSSSQTINSTVRFKGKKKNRLKTARLGSRMVERSEVPVLKTLGWRNEVLLETGSGVAHAYVSR